MPNIRNKVIYHNEVLIDLTADTAEEDKVLSGYTFHKKSGVTATGTCTYDADTSDATANASEILYGETAYVSGAKVTGSMPNNGSTGGTISTVNGDYSIPQGYSDGSAKVAIAADQKALLLNTANIANGVTILGVTGTHQGGLPQQQKSFTPTASGGTVTPDSGYTLSQVTVNAIPYTETLNASGGYTVTIG